MRPINVLDLRDTYEIGGPGKTIVETQRAIDRQRFRLHVGVFLRSEERAESPFISAARDAGMPVHEIRGAHPYDPRLVWRTARLVRDQSIDIVHTHETTSDAIGYLATRIRRVPLVTTLHGWIGNGVKQRMMVRLDKQIASRFDRVITVSSEIHESMLAAGIRRHKLVLLRNAIVLERYRRLGRSGYLESLIGRPVQHPVVAAIGRLSPEKGQADLLDALSILSQKGQQLVAVLAGDGPDRARLEARARALGIEGMVHFPGYVREPQRLLEDVDLMVLPSHTEGLPNAALEAMAMEVPVLATRVGGTPDVVTDGETGRLVPPHSPPALAGGIADFLTNRQHWTALAARGRVMVEQQFSFAVRTRRLEALYEDLCGAAS